MGDKKLVDTMIKDGLWDAYNNYHMGTTAENINDIWGITREEQDAFAAASQQKTEAASKLPASSTTRSSPCPSRSRRKWCTSTRMSIPSAGVTAESIAKLQRRVPRRPRVPESRGCPHLRGHRRRRSAADKGTQRVTAANASGINDGAAAIVLASGDAVAKYGLKPMAKLIGWGQGGVDPKIMGVGPVPATRTAHEEGRPDHR